MKKLFTTLLLLGVVLTASARIDVQWVGGESNTLTVSYYLTNHEGNPDPNAVGQFTREYNNLLNMPHLQNQQIAGNVKKLVLIGEGFTNADFNGGKMGEFIAMCAGNGNTLYLDLTDASGLVSKVTYTSTDKNPVKNPQYVYSNETERKNLNSVEAYFLEDGSQVPQYNGTVSGPDDEGYYWITNYWYNGNSGPHKAEKKTIYGYYNNQGQWVTVDNPKSDDNGQTYYVMVAKDGTPFAFGNIDQNNAVQQNYCGQYLKGITFPKGSNFTAIPDKLCCTALCPNLETVVWGDQLEWIGAHAFRGGIGANGNFSPASELKYIGTMNANGVVTFPTITLTESEGELSQGVVKFPNTLKVIGMDAFYECTDFRYVNLDLENLVKVDAAAFNMYQDDINRLDSVQMPSKTNTSLKFWGNQVFSSSHIKTLDFRYCEGIKHFAYDGTQSMEELDHNPVSGGVGSNTFYWHQYMTTLVLPPNLEYVAGGDDANKGMTVECWRLETIEFTGTGVYGSDCTLTNPLVISKNAFKYTDPVDQAYNDPEFYNIGEYSGGGSSKLRLLKNVILSDNVVRICEDAFTKTSLESVAIPASVQEIEKHAFSECRLLTTVIFDDIREDCDCDPYPTHICGNDNGQGDGAFNNCTAVTDVYINTSALLDCQNNAFDAANTWGRGDAGRSFATLHFPIENIENYVNLKHALTDMEAADPNLFHDWLMDHYMLAGVPNMNGWYEFINSGPSKGPNDPGTQDIILQTFSDWNYSYLVPDGLRAYIVNEIGQDGENYVVTLKRLRAIPAKTGVILYGHPNGKTQAGNPTLALTPVQFAKKDDVVEIDGHTYTLEYDQGQPLSRDNWESPGYPEGFKNYLEPTSSPSAADVARIDSKITSLTNKIAATEDADEKSKLQEQLATAQAEKSYLESMMAAHPEWKNGANGEYKGGRYVKPFENLNDNDPFKVVPATSDIAFRNFAMSRYSKTHNLSKSDDGKLQDGDDDYEAFFRMIAGYYPTGKAFLRLADAEYYQQTGAEILVNKDEGDVTYHHEMNSGNSAIGGVNPGQMFDARQVAALNPNGWWNADHGFDWDIANPAFSYTDENDNEITAKRMNWGKRPTRFQPNPSLPNHGPIYLGEIGEETDGIVKLVIPTDLISIGEYYTLQGVKVNKPTKGVYIRDGKKVIIK